MQRRTALFHLAASPLVAQALLGCGDERQARASREPAPLAPLQPTEPLDPAFATGVIVGDAREDGCVLSALGPVAELTFVLTVADDNTWREVQRTRVVRDDTGRAQLSVSGLKPDTRYSVYALSEAGRSEVTTFGTAPKADVARVVRFGATSCLGGNLPFHNMAAVADRGLDFFLLLGDTVYADGVPVEGMPALYDVALAQSGFRAVTKTCSIVATWDDHEIDNNWSYEDDATASRVAPALAAFRAALPHEGGLGELGIYRSLRYGKTLELFVLDSRGERRDGQYLSTAQMQWFKAALAASTADWKIVLNSVPMTDLADIVGNIEAEDRWQGYPVQRSEILEYVDSNAIRNVVWLSGDFHIGAIGLVDPPGGPGASQVEILCGPAGSPINPGASFVQPSARIPTLIKTHNSVFFEADPALRTLLVEVLSDTGTVLGTTTVRLA